MRRLSAIVFSIMTLYTGCASVQKPIVVPDSFKCEEGVTHIDDAIISVGCSDYALHEDDAEEIAEYRAQKAIWPGLFGKVPEYVGSCINQDKEICTVFAQRQE